MNDKEIIKALSCCISDNGCEQCPILEECFLFYDKPYAETPKILTLSLDLINRQQEEIERLQNLTEKDFEQTAISTVKRHQKWIERRAIKEFAERLCEGRVLNDPVVIAVKAELKETVGDAE